MLTGILYGRVPPKTEESYSVLRFFRFKKEKNQYGHVSFLALLGIAH